LIAAIATFSARNVISSGESFLFQFFCQISYLLILIQLDAWFHLGYGLVLLPTGRMKSREGTVVDADDLIEELAKMAEKTTKEKWAEKAHKEKLAQLSDEEIKIRGEKVAMAAIKFYILSFGPATVITFDPSASLSFTGKSGPYLLYQYARTRSILRKAKHPSHTDTTSTTALPSTTDQHVGGGIYSWTKPEDIQFDTECLKKLGTDEEHAVVSALFLIPREIDFAAKKLDPSKICDLVYNICQMFNSFYKLKDKHQVLNCTDPVLKHARLLIVLAVGNAIKMCLKLLGIEVLEQM